MQVVDDVELDPVRIDVLPLVLLPDFGLDLTVRVELAAVREAFGDVLGLVRVDRAALFGFRRGLVDVVGDDAEMMQSVVAERLVARADQSSR